MFSSNTRIEYEFTPRFAPDPEAQIPTTVSCRKRRFELFFDSMKRISFISFPRWEFAFLCSVQAKTQPPTHPRRWPMDHEPSFSGPTPGGSQSHLDHIPLRMQHPAPGPRSPRQQPPGTEVPFPKGPNQAIRCGECFLRHLFQIQ